MPQFEQSQIENNALRDELEAINSIYDPDTISITSQNGPITSAVLKFPLHPIAFLLSFNDDYPDSPPYIHGTQSTGNSGKGEGETAVRILQEVVARSWTPGQVCLFDLIEEAEPLFTRHKYDGEATDAGRSTEEERMSEESTPMKDEHDLTPEGLPDVAPDWTLSEAVSEKKSTFVARCVKISSKDEASTYINHLLSTNKKVAGATHNITAWRIQNKDAGTTVQDCDDDGETAAGGRVLHLMQLMDVWNVVVVVSRWYGGIQLGADRFRIINAVAREALVKGGFVQESKEGGGKKKGKK